MNKLFQKVLPLDKCWHLISGILIYFLLTVVGLVTINFFNFDLLPQYKILIVIAVGFLKEWLWDGILDRGTNSELDAIYTIIGGIICLLIDYF